MASILIIYSTTDGHTRKICRTLKQIIEQQGHSVELVDMNDAPHIDLSGFDKIVIGASIRYGKHKPQVHQFVKTNRPILDSRPSAFFTVNVVARKPEKNRPETNPYLKKFLRQVAWQPRERAVFAGKIDYQRYSFRDRQIIRFIMWLTKGPTDPKTVKEFTDWNDVSAFAQVVSEM